jgi:hypothetical protein
MYHEAFCKNVFVYISSKRALSSPLFVLNECTYIVKLYWYSVKTLVRMQQTAPDVPPLARISLKINTPHWNNKFAYAGFEVLTAVFMKSFVFWDIMPCSPLKVKWHFGRTLRSHHQDPKIIQARNEHEPGSKQSLREVICFRNVGWLSADYTTLYSRMQNSLLLTYYSSPVALISVHFIPPWCCIMIAICIVLKAYKKKHYIQVCC